jgi:DNA recombination protein RmuC
MNWILLGLLAINLLLLVWLLLRPTTSTDAAFEQLALDLKAHGDGRQNQLERDLRDELQRSASGTRQELSQGLGQAIGLFQQTLLNQQGDATRTQNEQLDSFRVQLAAMQQGLVDALRDSSHQASLQSSSLREAQSQALARFNEAQESALKRLSDGMAEQLRALSEANDRRLTEVRLTVEQRLQSLQADNEKKLEQMRQTVDEKLHATLEQRLGESFKQVADRLEQVPQGPGRDAAPGQRRGLAQPRAQQRQDTRHLWRGAARGFAGPGLHA